MLRQNGMPARSMHVLAMRSATASASARFLA